MLLVDDSKVMIEYKSHDMKCPSIMCYPQRTRTVLVDVALVT